MISAIAIDNDPLVLDQLRGICASTGSIQIDQAYTACEKAYNQLAATNAEVIFLNAGLDYAKLVARKASELGVTCVFMSRDRSHAVEAFNYQAADFLLQPLDRRRFSQTVEKIRTRHAILSRRKMEAGDSLSLRVDYTVMKLPLARILYIEGLDDYIRIVMHGQKPVVTRMTLKRLEEQLPCSNFARVHKSYIVPVHRINYVRNKIVHIGEHRIPLGSTYEQRFFQSIQHA